MKVCFAGDAIMFTLPSESYWLGNELVEIMAQCDIRAGNLEMVLSGGDAFASSYCGGQWLTTTSDKLDALLRFGFDYLNTANNHTLDFSYDGMRLTNDALDAAGVLHTGSGESLEEAGAPVFKEVAGKIIAFVSCTASCDDAARAGSPSTTIRARPGVSMLRHTERLHVTPDLLRTIDTIADKTCVNARFMKAVRMGIHTLPEGVHRLGRVEFLEDDCVWKETRCHEGDLARIVASIRSARKAGADLVIVSVHSHDIKGASDDTPDYYLEEFAHSVVDAGASAVVGTGTHQLKAIEVYKGAPIFYSLGNYVFRDEHMEYVPHDFYERYNADNSISAEELFELRTKGGTVGLEYDPLNYRSVVPVLEYRDDGELSAVTLHPIELGFNSPQSDKGLPLIAHADTGCAIFNQLRGLSLEYGTELLLQDGVITLDLR